MNSRPIARYGMNRLRYLGWIYWRSMLRKLSVRHLVRIALSVVEWRIHKVRVLSRPFAFRIEPASTCNLRCPLCSTTWRTFLTSEKLLLAFEDFKHIYTEIRPYASRITFYMEGEPLMNRHLFTMIRWATSHSRVFTSLSTNLTLLRPHRVEELMDSGLDSVAISLDGFDQKTYERYRVGGQVRDVLDAIRAIADAKKHRSLRRPELIVNMIRFHYTSENEIHQLQDFCNEHGVDQFRVRPEQFGLLGPYTPDLRRRPPRKCHWPWTSMSIDVDGSVYACPIAFEQRISFGNLLREPIDAIWNNDAYQTTRRYLSARADVREKTALPCYDCRWYGKSPATDQAAIRKQWLDTLNAGQATKADAAHE
jgi:radical SAM protein with 4Fe4S-binding SPASM domain